MWTQSCRFTHSTGCRNAQRLSLRLIQAETLLNIGSPCEVQVNVILVFLILAPAKHSLGRILWSVVKVSLKRATQDESALTWAALFRETSCTGPTVTGTLSLHPQRQGEEEKKTQVLSSSRTVGAPEMMYLGPECSLQATPDKLLGDFCSQRE